MAIRRTHYDAAFEAYLRALRRPYVAIDETRRALLAETSLKSFDFIVYAPGAANLLVEVKGRKFPSGGGPASGSGHRWENWATRDDLVCLLEWERVFGPDFRAVLVFAYHIVGETQPSQPAELWGFRERTYAFYGVWADEFARAMRRRSAGWDTVSLPAAAYRRLRWPLQQCFGAASPAPTTATPRQTG